MSYKTPKAMSDGLGSAGTGTHHWWQHRVSSIALIPLTVLAVLPFARGLGGDHADVLATYANPFNAIIAVLWLAVTFHHAMQGLQVVIERTTFITRVGAPGCCWATSCCADSWVSPGSSPS